MALCNALHNGMTKFLENGKYSDVSIRVQEKTFQCHRIVLASVCDYFDSMFSGNFNENPQDNEITLQEIDVVSFALILKFIYRGTELVIDEDNVYGLLRFSDFLGLHTIKNFCVEYILKNGSSFSSLNTIEVFHLACGMNDCLLMDTLSRRIVVYLKDFLARDFFSEVSYDCLNLILKQYNSSSVHFNNENFLLEAIVQWVHYRYDERRKHFQKLIDMVNFGKISIDLVEFILKKYQKNCQVLEKLKSDRLPDNMTALKEIILNEFSLKNEFNNEDDVLFTVYKDPQTKIIPSVYIYMKTRFTSINGNKYKVLSLNGPHHECDEIYNSWFRADESSKKSNWAISSTFSIEYDFSSPLLTTMNNHIYSILGNQFRIYHSDDLSSNQYTNLAPCKMYWYYRDRVSGMNDNIYFIKNGDCTAYSYNCNVDKWLKIPKPKTIAKDFCCVADNNLLYLIEGKDPKEKVFEEYVQAYDIRTPRWLELSKIKRKEMYGYSTDYGRTNYASAVCAVDGKMYLYKGDKFKIFDPAAGCWRDLTNQHHSYRNSCKWSDSYVRKFCMAFDDNKILIFSNQNSRKYKIYDISTKKWTNSTIFDDEYFEKEHEILEVLVVKSTEI